MFFFCEIHIFLVFFGVGIEPFIGFELGVKTSELRQLLRAEVVKIRMRRQRILGKLHLRIFGFGSLEGLLLFVLRARLAVDF